MNPQLPSTKSFRLKATMLVALWAVACGGTALDGRGNGASGGSVSSGGAVSSGGSVSSGGAVSSGGSTCDVGCPLIACNGVSVLKPGDCCPTCEPSSGGAASGGSGPICDVACISIGCGPGFKSITEPGACCPSCVPDGSGGAGGNCAAVDCAAIDCAPGYSLVRPPGSCCGTCVPNNACSQGQLDYRVLKSMLLADPATKACMTSSDCTLLSGDASCNDACASEPVNVDAALTIEPKLQQFAQTACSTCAKIYPPCVAPLPPTCFNHTCASVQF